MNKLFVQDRNTRNLTFYRLFVLTGDTLMYLVVWPRLGDPFVSQNPIIVIIYSLEFFTSVLADRLSQEYECQQVSSSLQESSSNNSVLN